MVQKCLRHQAEYLPVIDPHRNKCHPISLAPVTEGGERVPSMLHIGKNGCPDIIRDIPAVKDIVQMFSDDRMVRTDNKIPLMVNDMDIGSTVKYILAYDL